MNTGRQEDFYDAEPPQASRELAELRTSRDYAAPFSVLRRRVIDDLHEGKKTIDATVVVRVGDTEVTEAASGVGVVHHRARARVEDALAAGGIEPRPLRALDFDRLVRAANELSVAIRHTKKINH